VRASNGCIYHVCFTPEQMDELRFTPHPKDVS